MTTPMTTTSGYKRLDMAQLPPYKLERIYPTTDNFENSYGYLFKNIYNPAEAEAEAAEAAAAAATATVTRHTQTKSTKMRRPFCEYCKHRKFPLKECKTHYTKSSREFGAEITCPHLLKQQCVRCGEIGHTPKYCKSPHWLNNDPCQITLEYNTYTPEYITNKYNRPNFSLSALENENEMIHWQKPIPPALQAGHNAFEDRFVKPSRIWIEMTGDHRQYTNDYMLCTGGPEFVSFDIIPKTVYEQFVEQHYRWMRSSQFAPKKKKC